MSSNTLTGWLLIAGPLLTFLVLGLLQVILIGQQDTPADSVAEMMENVQLSKIVIVIGAIVFVATFAGLTLLARSMQQEDKSGTATLATIVFAGLTAVGIAASGMSLGTLDAAKEISTQAGVNIESVASFGMFAGLFLFWGVGFLLLGSAMIIQKKFHILVRWLFVALGTLFVILTANDLEITDVIQYPIWGVMTLLTAAAGILTLREESVS